MDSTKVLKNDICWRLKSELTFSWRNASGERRRNVSRHTLNEDALQEARRKEFWWTS